MTEKSQKAETKKLVIKEDNWIVQETYNDCTKEQNQLIRFLIAHCADYKNNELRDTVFPIGKILLGTGKTDGGKNYDNIRKIVGDMFRADAVFFEIYNPEKNTRATDYIHYFQKIRVTEDKLDVIVIWSSDMKQYFSGNSTRFTQFKLEDYLKLNSSKSQNLYELLKSVQNYEKRYGSCPSFEIKYLRWKLRMENVYPKTKDFKQKLKDLVEEINEKTDIKVKMTKVRNSDTLTFHIEQKNPPVMYLNCWFENKQQRDEIIYDHKSKDKIEKLGKIKKNEPDKYETLKEGGKSDYDIIMMWVRNEQLIEEAKKNNAVTDYDDMSEEEKIRMHIENGELPKYYGIIDETEVEPELLARALELQKRG